MRLQFNQQLNQVEHGRVRKRIAHRYVQLVYTCRDSVKNRQHEFFIRQHRLAFLPESYRFQAPAVRAAMVFSSPNGLGVPITRIFFRAEINGAFAGKRFTQHVMAFDIRGKNSPQTSCVSVVEIIIVKVPGFCAFVFATNQVSIFSSAC